MKKKFIIYVIAGIAVISGCKKEDGTEEKKTSTETTAAFDHSNFGLYKGIIVGSSGTVKIQINNGDNVVKADIVVDSKSDVATCSDALTGGQAIRNAVFTGASSSFTFSVDANGKNPSITNMVIEGHDDVAAIVFKETSDDAVAAYEGTLTGGLGARGIINITRNSNTFKAITRITSDGVTISFYGTVKADGSFSCQETIPHYQPIGVDYGFPVKFNISGSFKDNQFSGSWNNQFDAGGGTNTNSGTFSNKKSL
jgi:hypothetical protein